MLYNFKNDKDNNKRGSVGARGLDLTQNYIKLKRKTNQSRTNGPINAHLTIAQV